MIIICLGKYSFLIFMPYLFIEYLRLLVIREAIMKKVILIDLSSDSEAV